VQKLKVCAIVFLAAAVAIHADAQDKQRPPALSPELRRFAEECDILRRGRIHKLEESIRGLRSGQIPAKHKDAEIRQNQADIAALRARKQIPVPSLRFPPQVGNIGRLPGASAHVEQIVGPQEMLISCTFNLQVIVTRHYQRQTETEHHTKLFRIRGVATKDLNEGSDCQLLDVFRISGNQPYRTADGKNRTTQVLVPIDMRSIEAYVRLMPD
jgi:hypothetical protein